MMNDWVGWLVLLIVAAIIALAIYGAVELLT